MTAILWMLLAVMVLFLFVFAFLFVEVLHMASTIEKIVADVAAQTSVVKSVVTLVGSLTKELVKVKDELASAGVDTTVLDNLAAQIEANTQSLADAVPANTEAVAPVAEPAPAADETTPPIE